MPKIEEYPYEFGRNILLTDSGFLYFDSMVTNGLMKVVIDGDKYLLNVTFINDIKYILVMNTFLSLDMILVMGSGGYSY